LWATPSDLTEIEGNYIDDTERKITQKGLDESSTKLIEPGNLIFSSRATIGECKINEKPIATNQGFQNIVPNKEHDNMFVFYAVNYNKIKFIRFAYGTTFLEISKDNVKKIKIPFPKTNNEESKISSILINIDNLIQKISKNIEIKNQLKTELMQKLFTQGIGHTDFYDPRRGYSPYQLEKIPKGWDYVELSSEKSGKLINGLNKKKEDYGHGCMHVNIENLFEIFYVDINSLGKVNATKKEINDYQLEMGDVCFLRSSVKWEGVGYPALFFSDKKSIVFSGFIIRLRPDLSFWDAEFLTYLCRTEFIRINIMAWATVSANVNINQNSLGKIPLPHPSIDEQVKIASILKNIDLEIISLVQKKSQLQKTKNGLMQKLLTGQIRVAA